MNIIIILALATFLSTLIGGFTAIKFRKSLPYFFAFSAGALLAVAFFDLLPESIEIANKTNLPLRYIMLVIVSSFLVYSLLEKYFIAHYHDDNDSHAHPFGPLAAGSLVIHSFLDGAAIGAAYQVNAAIGLVVAFAVISHDFTDGINTVTLMLKNRHKTQNAIFFLIMDAIAPVLGVLSTTLVVIDQSLLSLILAFFVGEFIYIGAANLLPETHKHRSLAIALLLIFGAALIFTITSFI